MNLVMTVGANGDPAALGPQPRERPGAPVRAAGPGPAVCDAVICHCGSGTMLGALAHGLPQLVLPQGADQFENADAAGGRGRGPDAAARRGRRRRSAAGSWRCWTDGELRAAAGRLRDELDAMPLPDAAIERIEALAVTGVSRARAACARDASRSAAFVARPIAAS